MQFIGVSYFPGESDKSFERLAQDIQQIKAATGKPVHLTELGSAIRLAGSEHAQRDNIEDAIAHPGLRSEVEAVWIWNRFAVKGKRDRERYTIAAPAIRLLEGLVQLPIVLTDGR